MFRRGGSDWQKAAGFYCPRLLLALWVDGDGMSRECVNTCDNCGRPIDAEQARLLGCCSACERALHATWANLDRANGDA